MSLPPAESPRRDTRSRSLKRMVERVRQAQTLCVWLGRGVKEAACHGFGGWEMAGLRKKYLLSPLHDAMHP